MTKVIKYFKENLWAISVVFAVAIPLLPEYFAPILAVLAFVFAVKNSVITNTDIKVGLLGKIILAYIAYTSFGLFYTDNFFSTLSTVGMWCVMFLVYLSIYNVANSKDRLTFVFYAITITAGIVGLISVLQYYTYFVFGNTNFALWNFVDKYVLSLFNERIEYFFTGIRMSSTFNNPNVLASYFTMVFPFVVYFSNRRKSNKIRPVGMLTFFAVAFGIAFSFSRSAYLALVAMSFIFFIFDKRKKLSILMFLLSGLLLFPSDVISRFFTIGHIDNSINARINTWVAGIKIFSDNPLFGNGAGIMNTWDHLLETGIDQPHMHNLILQIVNEGGLLALMFFVLAGGVLLINSSELYAKKSQGKALAIAFVSFLVGFMVFGMSDFPLMTPKLVGTFLMIGAIIDKNTNIKVPQYVFSSAKFEKVELPAQLTRDKIKRDKIKSDNKPK